MQSRARMLIAVLLASALVAADDPQQLLRRGENDYRAGHYAAAVESLRAASAAMLTADAQRQYVDEARLPDLAQFEEALVYLALSYAKLGRDAEARDAILRLMTAEKIAPAYAGLQIGKDRDEFETIANRLGTAVNVPATAAPPKAEVATNAAERDVLLRLIEERAAEKRAYIEREASAKVTAPAARPVAAPAGSKYDQMARNYAATSGGGRYTVQLEIACEAASITNAIRTDSVWFVPIAYRGRPCYRVFRGHFATESEAQRAQTAYGSGVVVREPAAVR